MAGPGVLIWRHAIKRLNGNVMGSPPRTEQRQRIAPISREENDLLSQVEGQAPMGALLRDNFWVPAILASRVDAGGDPVRVKLIGERYVAFRAHDGRVGFFDEDCPHRLVSLALARNEDNALTCIFHGWKFGVDGTVLDVPTQPFDRAAFCEKVPLRHYPVREAGGLIWVFLGGEPPRFPDFEFTQLQERQVSATSQILRYNWVQALDSLHDSGHIGILHQDFLGHVPGNADVAAAAANNAPTYEFVDRPAGYRFAAIRELPGGRRYCRITEYVAPFFTFIAYKQGYVLIYVPVDDVTTQQFLVQYNLDGDVVPEASPIDDPADWPTYPQAGAEGNWGQDRAAMRRGAYSGFALHAADFAIGEAQGRRAERHREFLHDGDACLMRMRRFLIDCAANYRDGIMPLAAQHIEGAYRPIFVGDRTVAMDETWDA